MKCGLCSWQEKPDLLPKIKIHAEGNHFNEDVYVVWRDQEFFITKTVEDGETLYDANIVKYEIPKEPPVVTPFIFSELDVSVREISLSNNKNNNKNINDINDI
jgi:hypothetical protein